MRVGSKALQPARLYLSLMLCVSPGCQSTTPFSTKSTVPTEPSGPSPDTGSHNSDTGSQDTKPHGEWDLDGDGNPDTSLEISSCASEPETTCLAISSLWVPLTELHIASRANSCLYSIAGTSTSISEVSLTGDHTGDGLSEVTVVHCPSDGLTSPTTLSVVDLAAAELIGQAQAPAELPYTFVSHPAGPDGLRYPVVAPGYGDGSYAEAWAEACVFRPDLPSDLDCGAGFVALSVPGPDEAFREFGGTVQDIDGDGWEDLHLIYHGMAWYGSVAHLTELSRLTYDVALNTEPSSPVLFHSGRNYGSHRSFTGTDGMLRTVVVGGAPLGSFTDTNCNVSRFLAMLDRQSDQLSSQRLAWSHYFGFASTIFTTYDSAYTDDPSADIARPADVMDGCVHRFSDSRSTMDGEPIVLVNYFAQEAPFDLCLDEQWALYQEPAWTEEKADAWYSCFGTNIAATGVWGMQVFRESDGVSLTGGQQHYVWGWSNQLLPSGENVYLLELLPGSGRFDLADREPSALVVYALVGGLWTARGSFPVVGRPLIDQRPATGTLGLGSFSTISELTLEDTNGDGLLEVGLEDGSWIGWDSTSESFVLR